MLDMTRAGFWIAYNALRDLAHGPRNAPPSGSATTPILVEHGVFGRVVWLSVELLPDQPPGFDPDPRYLGLMAIEARGAEAFAASMRSVWRKVWDGSELGNGRWRGRWRIQDRCPLASPRFANRSPAYFSRLRGRSAEASAAIALWAAAGRIPDDPPYVRPEGSFALLPEVAISASLAEPVPGEPLVALKLEPVDAAPAKRRAATDAALDLVIFADDRPVAERHAARAGPQPSHSIGSTRFEGRATLSGALREMLAVQRRLHHWHERRHAAWMKTSDGRDRWAPGTADLDAM